MPQRLTPQIIAAAIAGFEAQKSQIDVQISELRSMLDGRRSTSPTVPTETETAKPPKKRSAAVRRKMALAQKARWTKLKEAAEPTQAVAEKPKKKRKMSAAGRKAISD